ncbi:SPFH domain-containing protein [Streptomyces sp. NPDC127098]|uniref:protein kinase domain-containing protein n=1 Tax=Streptomyces sp. NPDC127098 TaxID=3347137 RepID=UPI00365ACD9B
MDLVITLIANAVGLPLLIVLGITAAKSVPAGQVFLVERFGRYHRTLRPGWNLVIPWIEKVAHRVETRLRVVRMTAAPVATRDGGQLSIDITLYVEVFDPVQAMYDVADHEQALQQQVDNSVRAHVGSLDREQALGSRTRIGTTLHEELSASAAAWGVRIDRILVDPVDAGPAARGPRASGPAETGQWPLESGDPRRVGAYDLVARLGEGGMGTVFLGRSPDQRLVAVKVIRGQFEADDAFRRRFAREVETARRVGGVRTAAVVDADPDGEPPWLATEYIPGPSLQYVINRHGALPAPTLYMIAGGVAEALHGIHGCGIIHRDLKPSNIIVSEGGPRVIDFGIARAVDSTALTRTGHVVGTPGFLAPEQLTGGAVTPATDVYAYGMVLCHAGGIAALADGQPVQAALGMLPAGLRDLVQGCLAPDPAARPSVAEISERLANPWAATVDAWLPPPVRTMIDLHAANTQPAVRS